MTYPSMSCVAHVHQKSLSKSDLDLQRSIFSRFRRATALFPCRTLCSVVIKGNTQQEIDKNRLNRQNCVRRPRANLTLSYDAEDSIDESDAKKRLRGLDSDWFWARCVWEAPLCGHRAPHLLQTPKNE